MSRVARSGQEQAAQIASLVRLLGGDHADLPSLLLQVERDTNLRFSAPCRNRITALSVVPQQTSGLLNQEILSLLVKPKAVCSGPGLIESCDWTVEEVRALAQASKDCNLAVKNLQHIADFYAFSNQVPLLFL